MPSCCGGGFYKFKVSEEAGEVNNAETKSGHIWTGFKEQTTAHGIPHVHQARGICKTVFWSLVSLACLGMLMYHWYTITMYYLSFKVDVVVALKHQRELQFPAVTICNMNPIKESKLYLSPDLQTLLTQTTNETDFGLEEKSYEIIAALNTTLQEEMGYNLSEFIIDCQYAGSNCHMNEFATFFDANYGNCFIFNAGWNSNYGIESSKRAGRRHGMKFVLNVKQDEYVQGLAQGAGARILIHSQSRMPFPSDEGILATPGQITSIGIRQVSIERLGEKYGNCTSTNSKNTTRNAYEQHYPVNYTSTACYKTCYQSYVIEKCKCADRQYPRWGDAFNLQTESSEAKICQSVNAVESACKGNISIDYQNNNLECSCPTQCQETAYSFEVSNVEWPSEVHEPIVLQTYADKIPEVISVNDTSTKLRRNVLKVEVYFQEFNFETMTERPAYLIANYFSDIGGILGLWLGLSVLSIFEFFELAADFFVWCGYKCCNRQTKTTDLTKKKGFPGSPPPPYSSNGSLSRNTVSTSLQDNVNPDGSLRYV